MISTHRQTLYSTLFVFDLSTSQKEFSQLKQEEYLQPVADPPPSFYHILFVTIHYD